MLKGLLFVMLGLFMLGGVDCRKRPARDSKYGGTLRIGAHAGKPSIINPILTEGTISAPLLNLVFNSMERVNKDMMYEPDLAESWEVSADKLAYTFHLRRGVRFHDGVELTARDAVFTFNLLVDPETGSPHQRNYTAIKDCQALDRYTFRINLKEPVATNYYLLTAAIVPEHLLKSDTGARLKTSKFNHKPIGTGPFRFVEQTENGKVVLEANPDYYEGRPYLDRIIASGYETTAQCWNAFMHNEIDLIFYLSRENFEVAKRDKEFRTYVTPNNLNYVLEYNPGHPILKDKRVRQAITQSIDIDEIIRKVEGGYGVKSAGPFLPGSWANNPEVKPFEYNPALSLKLLNESGWKLNDSGILERAGQEFRFTMICDTLVKDTQLIARLVYQYLYRIGVRVDIITMDYRRKDEDAQKGLVNDAGVFLLAFGGFIEPLDAANLWHSQKMNKEARIWQYNNPEVSRLFDLGINTSDINQQKKIYRDIHKIIYKEQPATFLYYPPILSAVNARIQNTDAIFNLPEMPFYYMKDWSIKPSNN
ncbi:MAG: ABC transporter substrate-binding protein [Planctomycetota bacterium]